MIRIVARSLVISLCFSLVISTHTFVYAQTTSANEIENESMIKDLEIQYRTLAESLTDDQREAMLGVVVSSLLPVAEQFHAKLNQDRNQKIFSIGAEAGAIASLVRSYNKIDSDLTIINVANATKQRLSLSRKYAILGLALQALVIGNEVHRQNYTRAELESIATKLDRLISFGQIIQNVNSELSERN
jgi:hypothetical protein